jgi:uncharacterized protein (TIGR02611 family)
MLKELKQHWAQFKKYPSGERFERYYRARHETQKGLLKKTLLITVGSVIMAAGIIFLAIPGPGLLVMLGGAALIARESLFVSRLFDRLEPRLWRLTEWCEAKWKSLSPSSRILLIALALVLGAFALYIAYKIFFT